MAEEDTLPQDPVERSFAEQEEAQKALLERYRQLQSGLERRSGLPFDPTLMRISQAFFSPTRTGSFGESLGNVAGALVDSSEAEAARQQNMLRMQAELEEKMLGIKQKSAQTQALKRFAGYGQPQPQPVGQEVGEVASDAMPTQDPNAPISAQPSRKGATFLNPIAQFGEQLIPADPNYAKTEQQLRREMIAAGETDIGKINKAIQDFRDNRVLFKDGHVIDRATGFGMQLDKTIKPGFEDVSIAKALGLPDDYSTWTPTQHQLLQSYKNAPNDVERARLINEVAKTVYETGSGTPIPLSRSSFFGGVPDAKTQAPTTVAQAPQGRVKPAVTDGIQKTPNKPIIEQLPPKERDKLLLDKPQQISSAISVFSALNQVNSYVDRLLRNKDGLSGITGASSMLPNIPGRPSANAQTDLETLRSQASVLALQAMRDASPTGGAVGSVTEREWPRLESAFGNLRTAQTYEQVVKSLEEIKSITGGAKQRILEKYELTYGKEPRLSSLIFTVPGAAEAFEKNRK